MNSKFLTVRIREYLVKLNLKKYKNINSFDIFQIKKKGQEKFKSKTTKTDKANVHLEKENVEK